jgi:hypothetical protein
LEKKAIKTGSRFTLGRLTLVPVVESGCTGWQKDEGVFFTGYQNPLALISVNAGVKQAFLITGEEIALAELIDLFPSVKAEIEAL